jgi:hypothetical protein
VSRNAWREDLGERIVAAVTPYAWAERRCGGFRLFGDSTWCLNAMHGSNVLGLSYGIEERDLWSEMMSNVFHMPTKLYDCFTPPARSPPIAGTAPNGTVSCQGRDDHCYESPYESFRTCLGPEAMRVNSRSYETLQQHLQGRAPLSTHVKIDTEGTEWGVLEQLVASEVDQDKIRTLEMEVHFSYRTEGDRSSQRMPQKQFLERNAGVLEKLRDKFVVTGSTLEVYREDWHPEKECARHCVEPAVHIPSMSVDQFAVSYVHRDLLLP